MELSKKNWMIIGIIALLVAIYFLFIRKNIKESKYVASASSSSGCPKGTYPCSSRLNYGRKKCCNA